MAIEYYEISQKAYEAGKQIPEDVDINSLESHRRFALRVTGMFFDPQNNFGNLWLGATFGEAGRTVQEIVGDLEEKPELRPIIMNNFERVLRGASILQTWQSLSIPNAVLAEVRHMNRYSQLGWFNIESTDIRK